MIFGIACPYNEVTWNHHGENKLFLSGCFSKTLASGTAIHLLVNHEPANWIGSTRDILELRESNLGLAFRVTGMEAPALRSYGQHMASDAMWDSVSIGIDYANADKVTRRIDDADVVCIGRADVREVSLMTGWNAGSSRRAFATLGECPNLQDEGLLAREASANRFRRALKQYIF